MRGKLFCNLRELRLRNEEIGHGHVYVYERQSSDAPAAPVYHWLIWIICIGQQPTDQIHQKIEGASMTVMFDIAEGSGEYSAQEKSRFYRMARRSATECASIFDIGQRIRIIEQQRCHRMERVINTNCLHAAKDGAR